MRFSIKLIVLFVTLFACLELSNAVPKGRGGGGGGRGGKLKSPTKSLYISKSRRELFSWDQACELGCPFELVQL